MKLTELKGYVELQAHINSLLSRAKEVFRTSDDGYALFLAYLIIDNKHDLSITNIHQGIQLLLREPQKFWFNDNYSFQDVHVELKFSLIKYMIVTNLESLLENNLKNIKKNSELKKFINGKKLKLEKEITNTHEAILEYIFSQNMGFTARKIATIDIQAIKIVLTISSFFVGIFITGILIFSLFQRLFDFLPLNFIILLNLLAPLAFCFFSYKMLNSMLNYSNACKTKFIELNIPNFIWLCKNHPELRSIISTPSYSIDDIWFRSSHLSEYESKTPIFLRNYIHGELEFLRKEMKRVQLVRLLITLLRTKIPVITDLPYSVPIDFLHNPRSWILSTSLENKDCDGLLNAYGRQSIIDFVTTILLEPPALFLENDNKNLLKNLKIESQKIKNEIEDINSNELDERRLSTPQYIEKTLFHLFSSFIFWGTFLWARMQWYSNTEQPTFLKEMFVAFLFACVMTKLFHVGWKKSFNVYHAYQENKKLTTLEKFLQTNKNIYLNFFEQPSNSPEAIVLNKIEQVTQELNQTFSKKTA